MVAELVCQLHAEASRVNERRLLVLTGPRDAGFATATRVLDALDIARDGVVLVSDRDISGVTRIDPGRAEALLGTTNRLVILDAHCGFDPNTVARCVGTVDGGGLFVLLCPELASWPEERDRLDESLAVPPFGLDAVSGFFRTRVRELLWVHPGIAIVEVPAESVVRSGLTRPAPRMKRAAPAPPSPDRFPSRAYDACLTHDQAVALSAFEALWEPETAVVVEADRGRGKSSVAGLAAAAFAAAGQDVVITAPRFQNAREGFARASEFLTGDEAESGRVPREMETEVGGRLRFVLPANVAGARPDVCFVDEAAAVPVPVLTSIMAGGRVGFTTTVYGYEGGGRGFSLRFREQLASSDLSVSEVSLHEPIRYAAGDPVEVWSFRAFLFDARPAVEPLVSDAVPASTEYRRLSARELADDEGLLREVFGLLVLAHYRTEPADLARLLDAPNVAVRALCYEGHVVSVALLAREGGLPASRCRELYDGGSIRGHMLPDLLTSQLRDEQAAGPVGWRVMRIATHGAVRSRGLGSKLLDGIRDEFAEAVDWLGVGFGATPELVSFWAANGYSTVHLSTTRNDVSGEHSAVMLNPLSDRGRALHDRHAAWFARRIQPVLSDALSGVDPDVVRATMGACDVSIDFELSEAEWRHVVSMAVGPGVYSVDPGPFRELAVKQLIDPVDSSMLSDREERLLVLRVLQARPVETVVEALGFPSRRVCLHGLAGCYAKLIDCYGSETAFQERDRYSET